MKRYLVTGGLGFIGSNFVNWLIKREECVVVIADKFGYASNMLNIERSIPSPIRTHRVDLGNPDDYGIDWLFAGCQYDGVFHFAAESHVDNSIDSPVKFTESNVLGTHNILEAWRKHQHGRFVHISTDEVYGHLTKDDLPFTEDRPVQPRSPYAASKAASDLIVKSYHETYGSDVVITRCCNNYGPRQHIEKFIPKIITNILKGEKVPVYGAGENIREWIHVDDHIEGVWSVFESGDPGEVYNIGSGTERTNIEIVEGICKLMNVSSSSVIKYVEDRKGHDFRYAIDSLKIRDKLMWKPKNTNHEANLEQIINWYKEHT